MHAYVAYVQERGQSVPKDVEWDHVPVDVSSFAALQSSLAAREVFVKREAPVRAWHLVDAESLAEVVEGCKLKVVRAGAALAAATGTAAGPSDAALKAAGSGTGAGPSGSQVDDRLTSLEAEIAQLKLSSERHLKHRNLALTTTQQDRDIGKTFASNGASWELSAWHQQAPLPVPLLAVPQCESVLEALRKAFPHQDAQRVQSLVAAGGQGGKVSETQHMQPAALRLLTTLADALDSPLFIADTHSAGLRPDPQRGRVDCSILADNPASPTWPYLVVPVEFKLEFKDDEVLGQLIGRCQLIFEHQPLREYVYGVALSRREARVILFQRLPNCGVDVVGKLDLHMGTGQYGSLCDPPALAPGVQALARILACTREQLGFKMPACPQNTAVQGHVLQFGRLLARGTRPGPSSTVYLAKLGTEDVVVKKACNPREVEIMEIIQRCGNHTHIVKLCRVLEGDVWSVPCDGLEYKTLILSPYCKLLSSGLPTKTYAQVGHDVARAVEWLLDVADVQHRDISAFNIGLQDDGRGLLFDFSASKIGKKASAGGAPMRITGTPLFISYELLRSGNDTHTLHTHLESLYLSLRYCAVGDLPYGWVHKYSLDVQKWQVVRWGYMTLPQSFGEVTEETASFLNDLHRLFWPRTASCMYCPQVSFHDFIDICQRYGADS